MISLPGYQISTQIHQSFNSLVYRGYRESDNLPVILKVLRQEYPTPTQLTRYKQEYQIARNLNLEGVVKAYCLESYQNTLVIVFEDFGGESLKILAEKKSFSLKGWLQIAIAITEALGKIHRANIIHKDLNPSNIVYNPQTQQLKLIDFGISTQLSQENPLPKNPNLLEGTLAYISPEQTGRMNRALDYRSDFYSLGVTFYELLTGELPFEAKDSLELIYCHLAKQPTPPAQQQIPNAILNIVLKLMAKTPEILYQSAYGIKVDLEKCWQQLVTKEVIETFPLGTEDITSQFQIPQKLYGREKEVHCLLTAFERVTGRLGDGETGSHKGLASASRGDGETRRQSNSELFLISGYSGIGKSALVKEIYRSVTEYRGYFITGKFDQYQKNIPYYGFIQAFKELIEQLLTETEAKLKQWKERLIEALGVNGQVVIDAIPEVELIIGKQPPVLELQPTESQNRFNLVIQNFIRVFTQPQHPLVLFLDDLQWAYLASIKLIQLLTTATDANSLLLIGAYRDNEVDPVHPLMLTLEEIKQEQVPINQINLAPLSLSDINQLLADTLHSLKSHTQPLAKLLQAKTNGNPFFLREFLKSLYADKLLHFKFKDRIWQWNITEIEALQITDNVVDLMTVKLKKLSDRTQDILKLSSCIGNQFDLETLAIIAEATPHQVALSLHDAIAQGFIIPLKELYKSVELDIVCRESTKLADQVEYTFIHDRVREAAYFLIDETDKPMVHLRIGNLLLQNTDLEQQSEKIFDLVNQINLGRLLIIEPAAKSHLVYLNFIASKKAKAANAYQSAWEYIQISISLLDSDSWQEQYQLSLEIYQLATEIAYFVGNFQSMRESIKVVEQQARSISDRVNVYETEIAALISQKELLKVIAKGLKILQILGIRLPQNPNQVSILLGLIKTKLNLVGKQPQNLIDLPLMTDEAIRSAMSIMTLIIPSAYAVNPQLMALLIFQQVILSLQYGNTDDSPHAYGGYGLLLSGKLGDIKTGYEFGQLALNLLSNFDSQKTKAKVLLTVYGLIHHWQEHCSQALKPLMLGYQIGLTTGEFDTASLCLTICSSTYHLIGTELKLVEQKIIGYIDRVKQLRQQNYIVYLQLDWQLVIKLRGHSDFADRLDENYYDESIFLAWLTEPDNKSIAFHYYFNQTLLTYLFEQYDRATINVNLAKKYCGIGIVGVAILNFYDSLIALRLYPNADRDRQKALLKQVRANQQKMNQWADYAPMNFLHKFYLVEAEKHRVLKQDSLAIDLYDHAINLAHEHQYLNEEALAYELAAKFYLTRKNQLVAATYMKQARFCYLNWGANAKVEKLNKQYPELLTTVEREFLNSNTVTTLSSETKQETLDLATLIKTSQALAQITDLDRLLQTLLKFVLENAGAEIGFLILVQPEDLVIRAKGTTESINTFQAQPLDSCNELSQTIINYAYRTQEKLILTNASSSGLFTNDEYIHSHKIKSVLCLPINSHGKLIGILYLENNLAENVFTTDRLEILKLISAQAAISIDNALLSHQQQEQFTYQIGGCLTLDAPTYVVRQADIDLERYLKQGHYCYILNSRHMGKSSLRVRTMNKLQTNGMVAVAIDLTSIGSKNITVEQWYAGIIYSLVNSLDLSSKFNFRDWWLSLDFLSPPQRFSEFIQQILLHKIPEKIVIFIDEIDSTLGLNFNLDDFFAAIRYCYNNRANDTNYQRLSFVLLGVASPSNLVQDKNCTPFNIGRAIALQGFQLHQVEPLIKGLTDKCSNPEAAIAEVLAWTNGQPFLTQKICNLIAETQIKILEGEETKWVKKLIQERIIDNWEAQDDPQHFKTIADRLFNSQSDSIQLLQLYKQILQQGEIIADGSNTQQELLLSGLVRQNEQKLKTYNRLYQSIFDLDWCDRSLNK